MEHLISPRKYHCPGSLARVAHGASTVEGKRLGGKSESLIVTIIKLNMITETTYTPSDLHPGKCEWCGEESDEIVTTENGEKCIDCIEAEKFYQETMRGI